MQRDERRNDEEPNPTREPEEIVDASQPEADINAVDSDLGPEPSVPSDPTVPDLPASSLATSASDLSEPASDDELPSEADQEESASDYDTATRLAGKVTRIEVPEGITVPPTRTSEAMGDRHSHWLLPDRGGSSGDEPDAVDEIFPPELRLPLDSGDPAARPRTPVPEPASPQDGAPVDRGQTMPRVQVIVSLAGARALFEEGLQEAIRQAAPRFERIAQAEIKLYDFRQDNKRRAADYRLRGPG
jgi:hypothetical protein